MHVTIGFFPVFNFGHDPSCYGYLMIQPNFRLKSASPYTRSAHLLIVFITWLGTLIGDPSQSKGDFFD